MAKIINKKLFAGILALSAGCLLASCEPVEAIPSNYTHPIITKTNDEPIDFEDNIFGTLYESIASDTNSKVVEKILNNIVEKKFGQYDKISETFNDISKYEESMKAALDGKYFEGDDKTHKQEEFLNDVYARVSEAFYNEINSGSYNDEFGMFSEEKMFNTRLQESYKVKDVKGEVKNNKFYVTENFDKDDAFGRKSTSSNKLVGEYATYIEKKILPSILKDKLVEDYIFRKNPLVLGRSYGVKINYIKVGYDNDSFDGIDALLKKYAQNFIEVKEGGAIDAKGNLDLEIIADAIKGFTAFGAEGVSRVKEETDAYKLLAETYGTNNFVHLNKDYVTCNEDGYVEYQGQPLIKKEDTFFKDSKIGQLIDSYDKACRAEKAGRFPTSSDKAELDKFTSEGKSKEYGLLQKLIALAKEDYTTTDTWFVKSNGAGELPSAFTDRLFNIKVSQDIDKIPQENLDATNPEDRIELKYESSYLRNIKGCKFLIAKDSEKYSESTPYNYKYNDGSSAFWICTVEEAVSPAKFNEKSATYLDLEDNYKDHELGEHRYEDTGRAIAKVLASKDNYVKDAYSEYLNEYKDVIFYDSSLYDYFKSEYPDLDIFDED